MMGLLRYCRGEARLRLTGAAPQQCLNLLMQARIEFWEIEREDELHYRISVLPTAVKKVEELALRSYCSVECISSRGLSGDAKKLFRRPVLLFGLLAALAASFFLQSFVWVIEVQGNETVHSEVVLRALEELNIRCGAWAADIPYKEVKHRLLNLVPELSWIGINRTGGKLTVLVTEREFPNSQKPPYAAANIVAARDGVITEVSILEGMRLCKVGDTVKAGQILVSGFEDYGLYLRAVCAQAEIYAQTWRSATVVTPSQRMEKRYTGREWTQRTLIVGRKRINLCGNSGISDTKCDKMINVKKLALPNYTFPVTLETATYREYETVPVGVEASEAERLLHDAFERLTLASMIAGKIESIDASIQESGGLYVLTAESTCTEMLARLVPIEAIYEGESNE